MLGRMPHCQGGRDQNLGIELFRGLAGHIGRAGRVHFQGQVRPVSVVAARGDNDQLHLVEDILHFGKTHLRQEYLGHFALLFSRDY